MTAMTLTDEGSTSQSAAGTQAPNAEVPRRKSIKGHKRIFTPLGVVRGTRGVAEGWRISCKCGWVVSGPAATTMVGESLYRQHLDEVAATITALEPRQRAWLIPGHANLARPIGGAVARQPTADGWDSACACGWRSETTCATKRDAKEAYASHLDGVREEHWPQCDRCKERTRPSRMSTSSPQFCKPCRTAITREWAQAHPTEWERHKRKSYLKRKYGLTIEDADALIHKHEGKCAICGKSGGDSRGFRMHVDHKPGTRTVRGILCTLCNNGLGVFRDQPELLVRAAAYLVCTELNGPGPWRLEPEFVAAALQEIQSAAR